MDQLSNAWLGNWEKRVADNAFASDIEKAAARRLQEARSAGKIVRIYDEINWQEGKWRSSNALPMGDTGVTLEERTGPVLIERIDHKWTEARLRLDKLRLKDIDPDTKLLKSPRLSELPDSPAEWADYEKMVQREVGKCSVRAGILTADGRLIVSVGEGAAAGFGGCW